MRQAGSGLNSDACVAEVDDDDDDDTDGAETERCDAGANLVESAEAVRSASVRSSP
jgi:hypothetical protein